MPSKYPARNLTRDQIDEALLELAMREGNCQGTSVALADRGIEVDRSTLSNWKRGKYFDRYHEISAGIDRARRDKPIINGFREITQRAQDVAMQGLERLQDEIQHIDAKDLAKTIQPIAVTMGIASEKALLYEGRPTSIQESRNPDWYEARMQELGLIDGEAVEITDANVVAEDGLSDNVGGDS